MLGSLLGRRLPTVAARRAGAARSAVPGLCVCFAPNTSCAGNNHGSKSSSRYHQPQAQRRCLHLTPRESDHLLLHNAGRLAQYRLARGVRLNLPEAVALITMQMMESIRDGDKSVADLMSIGQKLLGRRNVQPGVDKMVKDVQVEATFPDGTKLLTVHSPIASEEGDLSLALAGSFLPLPADPATLFPPLSAEELAAHLVPGETLPSDSLGGITINPGRDLIELAVTNTGDRPIQVGSHYAFIETNRALVFDRRAAIGMRLNVPSGASVRFEPGETKTVTLVEVAGNKRVLTGNGLTDGVASEDRADEIMQRVEQGGFGNAPSAAAAAAAAAAAGSGGADDKAPARTPGRAYVMERSAYADMYGPTEGDRIVLGDTSLTVRVEKDYTSFGDECKFGGGKTLREGMGQATGVHADDALDTVITNALIIDAILGVVKADVGIKGSKIVGIGKAGNPDMMSGVDPNMIVGNTTEVIAGEKLILTAGGVDTHCHWICPQQCDDAIASGITTMYGGGTGPSAGTSATTCTPAPSQVEMMLKATDGLPLNFGFSGKGNTSDPAVLNSVLRAGAAGFKLHEDWGTTPSAIDSALSFADDNDVQITIHTDTLNESGFVDDSIAAMKGRTIHTYHTEGAGGGHAPDIIKIVSEEFVLPSSTNPTRPFTVNTIDEHLDMVRKIGSCPFSMILL